MEGKAWENHIVVLLPFSISTEEKMLVQMQNAIALYEWQFCHVWHWWFNLPMLRLVVSKAQERKDFWKLSKPSHVDIYWKALAEYSQMSTHMPVFQPFLNCCFLHQFVLAKLATNSIRVKYMNSAPSYKSIHTTNVSPPLWMSAGLFWRTLCFTLDAWQSKNTASPPC